VAIEVLDRDPGATERLAVYRDAGFRHIYRHSLLRPRVPIMKSSPGVLEWTCGS
jgi:hypothetical protein